MESLLFLPELRKIFNISILSLLTLLVYSLGAQEFPSPNQPGSHELYLELLRNAEEDSYNNVLKLYDEYLALHPDDITTRIERCRFIDLAMYDSYEEYNPNQAQFDSCLVSLKSDFGQDLRVMSFNSEYKYGDSALLILEQINDLIEDGEDLPEDLNIADIYERTAYQYSYQDDHHNALYFADKATKNSDSLNLSYFIASQHQAVGENSRALQILLAGEDSTFQAGELNQRALLALELEDSETAIRNFKWAMKGDTYWVNLDKYAEALINVGDYEEARKHLKESIDQYWSNSEQLFDLFDYDLKYMPADTAVQTYNRLMDKGWEMDAFGISRLRLIAQTGKWSLDWGDAGKFFAVIGVLALLFVLPYLWILPVQSFGLYRRRRGIRPKRNSFRWGLRHFWWVSFGYLLINFIIMIVFYYEDVIRFFFYDLEEMMVPGIDALTASSSLFFSIGLLLVVVLLTRVKDLQLLNFSQWTHGKTFGMALLAMFLLRFALGIYLKMADISVSELTEAGLLSNTIEIEAMIDHYGLLLAFLVVAVLVPIYEEFLFRGIILGACEKYVGFWAGNVIQSGLFAVVHNSWELIPFYFGFGFIAGVLRENSESLVAPIYMHMLNNALAILALWLIT